MYNLSTPSNMRAYKAHRQNSVWHKKKSIGGQRHPTSNKPDEFVFTCTTMAIIFRMLAFIYIETLDTSLCFPSNHCGHHPTRLGVSGTPKWYRGRSDDPHDAGRTGSCHTDNSRCSQRRSAPSNRRQPSPCVRLSQLMASLVAIVKSHVQKRRTA